MDDVRTRTLWGTKSMSGEAKLREEARTNERRIARGWRWLKRRMGLDNLTERREKERREGQRPPARQ